MDPLVETVEGAPLYRLRPAASHRTLYSGGATYELFSLRRISCQRAIQ